MHFEDVHVGMHVHVLMHFFLSTCAQKRTLTLGRSTKLSPHLSHALAAELPAGRAANPAAGLTLLCPTSSGKTTHLMSLEYFLRYK